MSNKNLKLHLLCLLKACTKRLVFLGVVNIEQHNLRRQYLSNIQPKRLFEFRGMFNTQQNFGWAMI